MSFSSILATANGKRSDRVSLTILQPNGEQLQTEACQVLKIALRINKAMGGKSSKYSSDQVYKFHSEGEAKGNSANHRRKNRRPPEGMPNPKDAPMRQNFLTVPTLVYVDDDTMSTVSAETTTLFTKSSAESSMSNLSSVPDGARKASSTW